MSSRLAALVAVAITAFSTAGCAQRASRRVGELQRVVFSTPSPGLPQTKAVAGAQIDLATAYAKGRGAERDVEFGCGLALSALAATQEIIEDERLRGRALRTVTDLCDRETNSTAALQLARCPLFGVTPQTLDVSAGARLTLSRTGVRLENSSGVHDNPWIVDCGDIIVSPRLVRPTVPPGSPYVPVFLETFL